MGLQAKILRGKTDATRWARVRQRGEKRRLKGAHECGQGHRVGAANHAPNPSQLALAPAAGSGIGRAFAEGLAARPDFVPSLVAAAIDGLKATRSYWSKAEDRHVTEPDYRTQLQAVALILANLEGEPVKRVVHQHLHTGNGGLDVTEALADSDAMREAMRRELQKADVRARKKGRRPDPAPAEIVVE